MLNCYTTHSRYGLGISRVAADYLIIVDGESKTIDSSSGDWISEASSMSGVVSGVGDLTSMVVNKGALRGMGEMSIDSCMATGEDVAGKGGVVMVWTGVCQHCYTCRRDTRRFLP